MISYNINMIFSNALFIINIMVIQKQTPLKNKKVDNNSLYISHFFGLNVIDHTLIVVDILFDDADIEDKKKRLLK